MRIDWMVVATIAAPIITLLLGAALNRALEWRPQVIAYFTHASSFRIAGENPIQLHTHGIVIRNAGRVPVTDVRVRHNHLPQNFKVFPDVSYEVQELPGGGREIVFPALVPGEQISISYLYFPPVLYSHIHAGIRHSQGFAREVTVLPSFQYPPWLARILWALIALGLVAGLYLVFIVGRIIWRALPVG